MRCCKKVRPGGEFDPDLTAKPEPAKADVAYERILPLLHKYTEPDQHLREQVLASKLAMGRTPVREALQRLAAEGLIVSKSQKGFFTRPLLEGPLLDLYEVASENLISAMYRMPPQVHESWTVAYKVLPDEPAARAEAIFVKIVEDSSNCESCRIGRRFSLCTRPLRMAISMSELRTEFIQSLTRLLAAMAHVGTATRLAESALLDHLDFERRNIPRIVADVNKRRPPSIE